MPSLAKDDKIIGSTAKLESLDNYMIWYVDIVAGLKVLGLNEHLVERPKEPSESGASETQWQKKDGRVTRILLCTISGTLKDILVEDGWTARATALETFKVIQGYVPRVSRKSIREWVIERFEGKYFERTFGFREFEQHFFVRWDQFRVLFPGQGKNLAWFAEAARQGLETANRGPSDEVETLSNYEARLSAMNFLSIMID